MGVLPVLFPLDLPRIYWAQSRISDSGRLWLWGGCGTLTLIGILGSQYHLAWLTLGIAGLFGIAVNSRVIEAFLLRPFETKVKQADPSQAHQLLGELGNNQWILRFAPFAWIELQKSRLNLALGDGRAAKRTLGELERLSQGKGVRKELKRSLALANLFTLDPRDRSFARKLLVEESEPEKMVSPSLLLWAISVILDSGHCSEVLRYLPDSFELRDASIHRQLVLGVAYYRCNQPHEALLAFESINLADCESLVKQDPILRELLHRARKIIRSIQRLAKGKKKAKAKGTKPAKVTANRTRGKKGKEGKGRNRLKSSSSPEEIPNRELLGARFLQSSDTRKKASGEINVSVQESLMANHPVCTTESSKPTVPTVSSELTVPSGYGEWVKPSEPPEMVGESNSTQARILELSERWDEWLIDVPPPEAPEPGAVERVAPDT